MILEECTYPARAILITSSQIRGVVSVRTGLFPARVLQSAHAPQVNTGPDSCVWIVLLTPLLLLTQVCAAAKQGCPGTEQKELANPAEKTHTVKSTQHDAYFVRQAQHQPRVLETATVQRECTGCNYRTNARSVRKTLSVLQIPRFAQTVPSTLTASTPWCASVRRACIGTYPCV